MFGQWLRVCLIVYRCYKKQCRDSPTDRSPIQGVLPDVFKQDSRTRKRKPAGCIGLPHLSTTRIKGGSVYQEVQTSFGLWLGVWSHCVVPYIYIYICVFVHIV
jgi:hypothetical protein